MQKIGKVYLVGAGPGDPGLITWRGMELLSSVGCVLYDNLANPELLSYCPAGGEKIFVGKKAGRHFVRQEDTIAILIEKAKSGMDVVRLKGGDPLVFGRGSEEAQKLKEAGIEFEIIPGVTAAIGATAYAGIPLTHRNMVTQCVMVTAHETPGKKESQIEWQYLAKMKNTTIIIYMGARKLPEIVETLIENGMPPGMPAASIRQGTMPNQKVVQSTLAELPSKVAEAGLTPPVVTVISPTIDLRKDIEWFAGKPLAGKRIIVTRARDQAASLYEKLSLLGAQPLAFPVIRTSLADPGIDAREIMRNNYDWIVFSSENGVRYFFEYLKNSGLDARAFGNARIAAIGSGTARRIDSFGLIADFVPSSFTSEILIGELADKHDISGTNILRVKGYFRQDPLTDGLRNKGAEVTTCAVYELEGDRPDENIIEDVAENGADYALFTSMSTVDNFFEAMGEDRAARVLRNCTPLAIGPVTATALDRHEIDNYRVAKKHNIDGMIEVLLNSEA